MTPTTHSQPVDVRDMVVVHTAMLREFRLAPALVERADGERQRRRVVEHLRFVCDLLEHHHEGEDELLWPLLEQRAPDVTQDWVRRMHEQHEALHTLLLAVREAMTTWERDPATTRTLRARLSSLHAVLVEHLDLEEREVLPVVAEVLTAAEWAAVGEAGAASVPKPKLLLVFGMFMYEGDAEVLRAMLSTAPPPVRVLVPRVAPGVYARYARRLYGTATP